MKLDGNKFKDKFGGWWRYMQEFVEGEKMYNLYQKLKEYGKGGVTITPLSSNTFKAFEVCPPENTKIVFIGSDPYPGRYSDGTFHATGISFDNSFSKTLVSAPSVFLMAISFILLWIEYEAKANNPKMAIKITMKFNSENRFLCFT